MHLAFTTSLAVNWIRCNNNTNRDVSTSWWVGIHQIVKTLNRWSPAVYENLTYLIIQGKASIHIPVFSISFNKITKHKGSRFKPVLFNYLIHIVLGLCHLQWFVPNKLSWGNVKAHSSRAVANQFFLFEIKSKSIANDFKSKSYPYVSK